MGNGGTEKNVENCNIFLQVLFGENPQHRSPDARQKNQAPARLPPPHAPAPTTHPHHSAPRCNSCPNITETPY